MISLNDKAVHSCLAEKPCPIDISTKVRVNTKYLPRNCTYTCTYLFWHVGCIYFQEYSSLLHSMILKNDRQKLGRATGKKHIVYMLRNAGIDVNTQDKVCIVPHESYFKFN